MQTLTPGNMPFTRTGYLMFAQAVLTKTHPPNHKVGGSGKMTIMREGIVRLQTGTPDHPQPQSPTCQKAYMHAEIRRARLQFKKGTLSAEKYEKEINEYISYSIREQEKLGVDVLVHGEPERTDM
jgi:hypothetical protein